MNDTQFNGAIMLDPQTNTSLNDLLEQTPSRHLLRFQYDLIESTYLLEQHIDHIDTTQQEETQRLLARFKRFGQTPPQDQDIANFETEFPAKEDEHPSYWLGTLTAGNWEPDAVIFHVTQEIQMEFQCFCAELWRAHANDIVSNIDDEDVYKRYAQWSMSRLHWLNTLPDSEVWLAQPRENHTASIPANMPYATWRQLIQDQRTYPPHKRQLFLAHIWDIDRTNHWTCNIPALNMFHVITRGPKHIWEITKDPDWYNKNGRDGLMSWNELLEWKTALVRVTDPDNWGLFEMVEEATD